MKKLINPDDYFDHPYNGTLNNERCVEITLGRRFLSELSNNVIEIGAVMPYYMKIFHNVYDPHDQHLLSQKKYAEEVDILNKNVLSISTIEHFGNTNSFGNFFNSQDKDASQRYIDRLLQQAATFFISIPIGAHPPLDRFIQKKLNKFNWFSYVKLKHKPYPLWELCETDKCFNYKYATPFECANAVVFLSKGVNFE